MPGFTALSVYKMEKPQSVTPEKLKQFAFADAPYGEAKAWGWTSIDDIMDTAWERSVPEKGEFMTFAFRVDTRKAPAPLVKVQLAEALREEEEKNRAEGKEFVSRARKKELKELITAKLLSKADPVPATIDVAVDMTSGQVYVGSTSKGVLGLFIEYFATSFGENLEPLISSILGPDDDPLTNVMQAMKAIYEQGQNIEFDGKPYEVYLSHNEIVHLTLPGGTSSSVSGSGAMSSQSVNTALADGLFITKIQLQLEETGVPENSCLFTWNSDFTFSGIKLPVLSNDSEDPDALFLEKLYLLGQLVGVMGMVVKG